VAFDNLGPCSLYLIAAAGYLLAWAALYLIRWMSQRARLAENPALPPVR
jgi:hypothetical protein